MEWENIESVLYFCAAHEQWSTVLELWQKIDTYVDFNGYWQKRRHWWAVIAKKKADDPYVRAKALAEKAWTLILMGTEHHQEAENCLEEAWTIRDSASIAVQACIANYRAVLARSRGDYSNAYRWLRIERE